MARSSPFACQVPGAVAADVADVLRVGQHLEQWAVTFNQRNIAAHE
jgi:hypothetical protein